MYEKKVNTIQKTESNNSFKIKAAIFLTAVGGISTVVGFSTTLASAKKQDTKYFDKGITNVSKSHISGVNLALRALGWGTLYAVSGTGILFYSIWKLSGAKNFEEFRYKIGSALPKIPKNETPGRSDFSGLNELLEYLETRK